MSFVDDSRPKRFSYQTEKPDRNWYEINAGVIAVLPFDLQVFGNYYVIAKQDIYDSHGLTLGIRADF